MTVDVVSTARPVEVVDDDQTNIYQGTSTLRAHGLRAADGARGTATAFTHWATVLEGVRGRTVQLPFAVEIRRTDDYVSVAEPHTGIHGVGSTLREAAADFGDALVEYRDVLTRQDELSPVMRDLLAFITSRLA